MAISDFTGRSVDLFIMQGAAESAMKPIDPGLDFDNGGSITTGVQKAVQFFLVAFFTEKGSRKHQPSFGSRFVTQVRMANMTDSFMEITFRDAAEDILDQQNRYRDSTAPDDEILSNIELISFSTASPSELSLTVQLTTLAGTTRVVVLPISLAIK